MRGSCAQLPPYHIACEVLFTALCPQWQVVGTPKSIATDIDSIADKLKLFSLLLIDEFDVATVSGNKNAVLAKPAKKLQDSCLQICVSGTRFRGDGEHENFPEPLDSALAKELMNTDPAILKSLTIRPRFAKLVDKSGATHDLYTQSTSADKLTSAYLEMLATTPSIVIDACLAETVMQFLKEQCARRSSKMSPARGIVPFALTFFCSSLMRAGTCRTASQCMLHEARRRKGARMRSWTASAKILIAAA